MKNFNKNVYIAPTKTTEQMIKEDNNSLLAFAGFWVIIATLVISLVSVFHHVEKATNDTWSLVVCAIIMSVVFKPFMKISVALCNHAEARLK